MGVAEVTTGAFLWGNYYGHMLFFVESQHLGWAELHADVTAFAPFCVNKNLPPRAFPVLATGCIR